MADLAPVLDSATRAVLKQLADIAVPPPVSWVPQTWGWAALAAVVLALAVRVFVHWRRRRLANRYRVEALAELEGLETQLADGATRAAALLAIPPLLKRVALAAYTRDEVAALSGTAWVDFLRMHDGGAAFSDAAVQLLDDVEYRGPSAVAGIASADATLVAHATRTWIKHHGRR